MSVFEHYTLKLVLISHPVTCDAPAGWLVCVLLPLCDCAVPLIS